MNILFLCSVNSGSISPFVREQIEALQQTGAVSATIFQVEGKGILGYMKNLARLKRIIREIKPDLVHAHYGFCGSLAVMQRLVPVVITYHGSDINTSKGLLYSKPGLSLAAQRIFVSDKLRQRAKVAGEVIPCGIDTNLFCPMDKEQARIEAGLLPGKKYVLFSSAFDNAIKNSALALEAMRLMSGEAVLLELKGYTRKEVAVLFNAVDVALLTSFSEGSPQFVKEALACACPVVATDVGDVKAMLEPVEGCYITAHNPGEIAGRLAQCLQAPERVSSRKLAMQYSNHIVASKLLDLYRRVLKRT